MTIDSIMNNSSDRRTRKCDGEDGAADSWMFKRVDLSLGSVSGRAGLHKGVSQEPDPPSQMKHAELKNCCFLFRVFFSHFRFDQAADRSRDASPCLLCLPGQDHQNLQSQPRRSNLSVPGRLWL